MNFDVFYHDLGKNEKSSAFGYLLLHLLKSSAKSDSGTTFLDQEVNIYLAQLLLSIANPRHIEQTKKFISTNDTDVAAMITESTDLSLKYLIYKSNADHLLTLTGIFQEPASEKGWLQGVAVDTLVGRGKTYYGFAAEYNKQIHRKVTAVMEILTRLSNEFEQYSRTLQNLSSDYFNLIQGTSSKEIKEFMEQISRIQDEITLRELQDEFLDVYSLWLKNRDEQLLTQMEELALKIKKHDPSFQFTPPSHA